ncbi:MAG: ISNCY family transposase [Chloroflexi bacterium]|nr:ISNCY family transposase [Chloroflexota bacterium]
MDGFIERLKLKKLTDRRNGQNVQYEVNDAAQAAFAIFFMQSASFLAGQRHLQQAKGKSNAETVFKMERIPTDTHIRNLLDPVSPSELSDEFRFLLDEMAESGYLKEWHVLGGRLAFSLDGVYYFSSQRISCPQCQRQQLNNGDSLYKHSAITPVVVAPGHAHVLPYVPEYILPQDGTEKQDCEVNAAKRWVQAEETTLRRYRAVLLGDDLYSKQPLCEVVIASGCDFIFVCHRDSHPALYALVDAVAGLGRLPTISLRHWNGQHGEIWTYHYLHGVLLRSGEAALTVNWCDLLITHEQTGELLYRNEWVTSLALSDSLTPEVVACGRARWKSENENNNVLKNHGYHLDHNFGHGQQHLSTTLLTLNLLAFLLHTIAQVADEIYQQIRRALGTRRTFFNDVGALMRYLIFPDWQSLLRFMFVQLELEPD